MSARLGLVKMKRNFFWDGFFFVFGFNSNPFLKKAKEISGKSVEQRISDNWERTSTNFKETFEKQEQL